MHDVVVFGDRPIGFDRRIGAIMHRLFLAQPLEIRPQRIVLEQFWRAGMKLLQRRGIRLFARGALTLFPVWPDGGLDIHNSSIPNSGGGLSRRCGPAASHSLSRSWNTPASVPRPPQYGRSAS